MECFRSRATFLLKNVLALSGQDVNGAWRAAWSSTAEFKVSVVVFFDISVVILGLLLIVSYVHE